MEGWKWGPKWTSGTTDMEKEKEKHSIYGLKPKTTIEGSLIDVKIKVVICTKRFC